MLPNSLRHLPVHHDRSIAYDIRLTGESATTKLAPLTNGRSERQLAQVSDRERSWCDRAVGAGYASEDNFTRGGQQKLRLLVPLAKDPAKHDTRTPARQRDLAKLPATARAIRRMHYHRGRADYKLRAQTVEPVFGQIKTCQKLTRACPAGRCGADRSATSALLALTKDALLATANARVACWVAEAVNVYSLAGDRPAREQLAHGSESLYGWAYSLPRPGAHRAWCTTASLWACSGPFPSPADCGTRISQSGAGPTG